MIERRSRPVSSVKDQRQQKPQTRHAPDNRLDGNADHAGINQHDRPGHGEREHQKDACERYGLKHEDAPRHHKADERDREISTHLFSTRNDRDIAASHSRLGETLSETHAWTMNGKAQIFSIP
ncbi:hypothetical protein [Rhizobium leguminosarum]|uniref:hypothetical protein n=1 Tax=Rhizobium leguminosarum TaxID=384 RepID=UPI001FE1DFCD|nr:hypothetical protein [Rhizobium leguminosarum]